MRYNYIVLGMTSNAPIHFRNLSKHFGTVRAVDDLSFTVQPGRVTGFLGPNGSGKTTTLRALLGLSTPTSGTATFGDTHYSALARPLNTVGAALEASSFHPGRTGRDHLLAYAPLADVPDSRADELLTLVGLTDAAQQRVGTYSMGMRQRLALAAALLGDPKYLILDEPANGLDPIGIRWLRDFLRHLAGNGKTVLVSSHILSEVQQSVDDVVIIANGKLRFADSMSHLSEQARPVTKVITPQDTQFEALAERSGWNLVREGAAYSVSGAPTHTIGAQAFGAGIELHELADHTESLEEFFLRITTDTPVAGNQGFAHSPGPVTTAGFENGTAGQPEEGAHQ